MPKKGRRNSYHSPRRKGQSASRKKNCPSDTYNPALEDSKTISDIHVQDITSTSSTEQTGDTKNPVSNIISQETYEIENNNDNISGNSDDGYQSDAAASQTNLHSKCTYVFSRTHSVLY